MRYEKGLFLICYLSTVALLTYTLMHLPSMDRQDAWFVILGWIALSGLQWILFILRLNHAEEKYSVKR